MRLLFGNVTSVGPVKPDLPVREITFIQHLLSTEKSNFGLGLQSSSVIHGLLPSPQSSSEFTAFFRVHGLLHGHRSIYPSVERPIIHQPEEPAPDLVIGLPSPGALENPPGVSRTLSSVAVTGEPDPGSSPSTSGASSSDIQGGCCSGGSSTSIGWRTLLTADANSDSDRAYQSSVMFVTSWMPNSSSIDCFESAGVSYLAASCSSRVFRWMRANPGGTLSVSIGCRASVGCRASGCFR